MNPDVIANLAGFASLASLGGAAAVAVRGSGEYVSSRRASKPGVADFLPYQALLEEDTLFNRDESLTAVYALHWESAAGLDDEEQIQRTSWLNVALVGLEGWIVHYDIRRSKMAPFTMPSRFNSPAAQVLAEARVQHSALWRQQITHTVALTFAPPRPPRRALSLIIDAPEITRPSFEDTLKTFRTGLANFESVMRRCCQPRLLGSMRGDPTRSDLLEAIFGSIFHEEQPVRPHEVPVEIADLFARDMEGGFNPKIGGRLLKVVPLATFPLSAFPDMLHTFSTIKANARLSLRMVIHHESKGRKKVDERRRMWVGKKTNPVAMVLSPRFGDRVNQDAVKMQTQAEETLNLLSSKRVCALHLTPNIVILEDDLISAELAVLEARRVFQAAGFVPRPEETVNAVAAWLGTLPGDLVHNGRDYLTNTLEASRFVPTSSAPIGQVVGTCKMCGPNTEPMVRVENENGGDYGFDLHEGDVAFDAIFGPIGGGKSFLLNFIAASFRRLPNDQVFAFDINNTQEGTCKALGGTYVDPFAATSPMKLAIFEGIEDSRQCVWLARFLSMIGAINGVSEEPERRKALLRAVLLMRQTERSKRCLSTFLPKVPDVRIRAALEQYATDGIYDGILDGRCEDVILTSSTYQVIELGAIMGAKDRQEQVGAPVVIFLLKSIANRLTGKERTLLCLDEVWTYFRSAEVVKLIVDIFKFYRRLHCGVVIATHHWGDLGVDDSILSTMLSSFHTCIFTPGAQTPSLFQHLDFTAKQVDMVRLGGTPKQHYFVAKKGRVDRISLATSREEEIVYGSTSQKDIERIRSLESRYGNRWLEAYLAENGCKESALRLKELESPENRRIYA